MNLLIARRAAALALLVAVTSASFAQSPIYRCGNEYTNNPVNAQARGCRLVEGGNLTIVEGLRPAAPAGDVKAAPGRAMDRRPAPVGRAMVITDCP